MSTIPTLVSAVEIVLTLDSDLLERIDALAEELGLSRNRVLAQATEEFLHHQGSRRLLARLDEVYGEESSVDDEAVRERRRARHRRTVEGTW